MKRAYLILALALSSLAACQNESDTIKAFIPGIYVKEAKSEFSVANDTLHITSLGGNAFLIEQSTGYRPIRNGRLLNRKFKKEKQTGVYDPQKQVMNETVNGRLFIFDPDKQVLLIGTAKYQKIN